MLNTNDILETIRMIHTDHLDIRTITMGVSLLDCASDDADVFASRIYDKITKSAERLVPVGEEIEKELGIPIVNSYNNRSMLNISAHWVRREASSMLTENTFRINIGFTFNERMFAKFKVE